MENYQPTSILLIEDNPDHADLTRRTLKNGGMLNELIWVKDGEEALEYLGQSGRHGAARGPRPGLILLDIKLPKIDGPDVLRRIKSDERLRAIPVVMLTTSAAADDVKRCYAIGVNSFITKPVNFTDFMEKINAVKLYWLLTNRLPQPE
jgi:CheY-like chemotaxis protein